MRNVYNYLFPLVLYSLRILYKSLSPDDVYFRNAINLFLNALNKDCSFSLIVYFLSLIKYTIQLSIDIVNHSFMILHKINNVVLIITQNSYELYFEIIVSLFIRIFTRDFL